MSTSPPSPLPYVPHYHYQSINIAFGQKGSRLYSLDDVRLIVPTQATIGALDSCCYLKNNKSIIRSFDSIT